MELDKSKYLDRREDVNEVIRGLPHWHQHGKLQFVTFHLADSLPASERKELKAKRENWFSRHPKPWTEDEYKEFVKLFGIKTEELLDREYGECILRKIVCADIVEDALMFFNDTRYILHSYVIMPNHVHVLYETIGDNRPEAIYASWKDYTTRHLNKALQRHGKIWNTEFYDRIIRNDVHYSNTLAYIIKNIESGGVRWLK